MFVSRWITFFYILLLNNMFESIIGPVKSFFGFSSKPEEKLTNITSNEVNNVENTVEENKSKLVNISQLDSRFALLVTEENKDLFNWNLKNTFDDSWFDWLEVRSTKELNINLIHKFIVDNNLQEDFEWCSPSDFGWIMITSEDYEYIKDCDLDIFKEFWFKWRILFINTKTQYAVDELFEFVDNNFASSTI